MLTYLHFEGCLDKRLDVRMKSEKKGGGRKVS